MDRKTVEAMDMFFPQLLFSRAVGYLASRRLPRSLRRPLYGLYASTFGVNLDEMEGRLEDHPSLVRFFTRKLRADARPVDPDPAAIVSPVDGKVSWMGRVEKGDLCQVKGSPYTLAELLGGEELAAEFEGGATVTIYLSPRDYHRIHTPVAGKVTQIAYEPGRLMTVNPDAVKLVDRLYSRNERLVSFIEGPVGRTALVKVGATGVGRITTTYDQFVTNFTPGGSFLRRVIPPYEVERGQELAAFELGSTVVLVFQRDRVELDDRLLPETEVRVGERIGILR